MSSDVTKNLDGPPTDRASRWACWACYFLLGTGMLASWNALISAADYTETMWPGRHMDRLLTVVYLPPCLFFLLATLKLSAWTRLRILVAYGGFALTLLVIPLMDIFVVGNQDKAPEGVYAGTLLVGALIGCLDGIGQGALYGEAALLPPEYTHAIVGGTASAGTLIVVIRVITKAAAPETTAGLQRASDAYFFMAAAIAAACFVVSGWVVPRLAVVRYWRELKIQEEAGSLPLVASAEGPAKPIDPMPPIPEASARGPSSGTLKASPFAEFDAHDAACAAGAAAPDDLAPRGSLLSPRLSVSGSGLVRTLSRTASSIASAPRELARTMSQPLIPASVPPPTVWELWRVRWRMITAMFMIYVITLCIFPGFLAEDVKNLQLGSWYPVILFLVFNVGDMVGKLLPHFRLAPGQTACLLLSLSRIVFIPAFYCAARFGAPAAVMAILTLLLGLSNGFLTALFFKLSPIGLRAIVAEGTAEFMVIGLVAGLNVGCYLGWLWLLGH